MWRSIVLLFSAAVLTASLSHAVYHYVLFLEQPINLMM